MGTRHARGALAPGTIAPATSDLSLTKGETSAGDAARGFRDQTNPEHPDFQRARYAGQALEAFKGEAKAAAYLERMRAERADPDELAVIVSMMYGSGLRGFCRVLEKALRGAWHG